MGSLLHKEIYKSLRSNRSLVIKQNDDYFPVYQLLETENFFYLTYAACRNVWNINTTLGSLCSQLAQMIIEFAKNISNTDAFKYTIHFRENYCVYIEQERGNIGVTILIYRLRLFKELLETFLKSQIFDKVVHDADFYYEEDTRLLRIIWTYGSFYIQKVLRSANNLDNDEDYSRLEEKYPVDFKILREASHTTQDFSRIHLLKQRDVQEEMFFSVPFYTEYPIV